MLKKARKPIPEFLFNTVIDLQIT